VPLLINYQARLTDAHGDPLNGPFSLDFALYDGESAEQPIWTETYDEPAPVVTNGLVSVILGSRTVLRKEFFTQGDLYLGIRVGGDRELTPRLRIVSTPFALSSLLLDGRSADDFEPAGAVSDHNLDPAAHPNLVVDASRVTGTLGETAIPQTIARTSALLSHVQNQSNPHKVTLTQAAGQTHHGDLLDVGTQTHAQIDAHVADRANPHKVRADNLICPEGTVDAGSYCIEIDERAAKTWFLAAQTCRQAGRRLCSPGEWAAACLDAQSLGLSSMTGAREWVDNWAVVPVSTTTDVQPITFGSPGCTDVDSRSAGNLIAFRCCE
jgi:hypothetical protein